jgi:transposase
VNNGVRIFVATAPVDFRGSFDRFAGYVRSLPKADPRSGAFFVFFNKRGDLARIMFFDGSGDSLLYKRLDEGTFRGGAAPESSSTHVEISARELERVLRGIVRQKKRVH